MEFAKGRTSFSKQASLNVSLIRPEFRKDYNVPGIDYQTSGIRTAMLWPSQRQWLRVIPGWDRNTGEIFRQNTNCGRYTVDGDPGEYISETFKVVKTMAGIGSTYHPFITSYRPGSPEDQRWGGDTILSWFASDVTHAVNAAKDGKKTTLVPGPEWAGWVTYDRSSNKPKSLSYDRDTLLMQALVWTINGRCNMDKDRNELKNASGSPLPLLYVLGIDSNASITAMLNALIEPQDPTQPLNGLTNNKFKGIAEQGGSMLHLLPSTLVNGSKTTNLLKPHVSASESSWVVTPFPLTDEQVKAWWTPWDEILDYMTPEQQCAIIAQTFGADTLNYVLANNRRLKDFQVPAEYAAAGFGRYAKYMGGSVTLQPSMAMPDMTSFGLPAASAPVQAPSMPAFTPAAFPEAPAPAPAPAQVQHVAPVASVPGFENVDAQIELMKQAGITTAAADTPVSTPAPVPAAPVSGSALSGLAKTLIGDTPAEGEVTMFGDMPF